MVPHLKLNSIKSKYHVNLLFSKNFPTYVPTIIRHLFWFVDLLISKLLFRKRQRRFATSSSAASSLRLGDTGRAARPVQDVEGGARGIPLVRRLQRPAIAGAEASDEGRLHALVEAELRARRDAMLRTFAIPAAEADAWLAGRRKRWIVGTPGEARAMVGRYAAAGIVLVVATAVGITYFQLWVYYRHLKTVATTEYFEATNAAMVYVVVAIVVASLVRHLRRDAETLRASFLELQATKDRLVSEEKLAAVGRRLGTVLAPVVGALNLAEVVLCGPAELLDGPLREEALRTIRELGRGPAVSGAPVAPLRRSRVPHRRAFARAT